MQSPFVPRLRRSRRRPESRPPRLEGLEERRLLSTVTELLKDVNVNGLGSFHGVGGAISGTAYFAATDGDHGRELWKSDGTAAGTALVADISPGPSSSQPYNLTVVDGTLFFTAFGELWKSDGTAAGTTLV